MRLHKPQTYYRMLKAIVKGPLILSEPKVLKTVKKIRGKTFVDVGANIGAYIFLLRTRFNHIHAIEPNPEAFRNLAVKAAAYKNMHLYQVALSERDGETILYLNKDETRCSGSADTILPVFEYKPPSNPEINRSTWQHEGVRVKTSRYDSMFTGPVDLVKIDVEGAEFLVLEGMKENLSNQNVKNLVVELHNRDRKHELEERLFQHGYFLQWLDADHLYAWTR